MQQFTSAAFIGDRSTCQCVASHARSQPTATAIADRGHHTSYRDLAIQILQAMELLSGGGIESGQVVGIETGDRHTHLVLMLACETLGAATISVALVDLDPPFNLRRYCDRFVVLRPFPTMEADKTIVMTSDWIGRIFAAPENDPPLDALERHLAPDAVVRLVKSSGTTGLPKVMRVTHRLHQRMAAKYFGNAAPRIMPNPGFLCLYHFSVRGPATRAHLMLQLGGTIYLTTGEGLWDLIAAGTGNYLVLLTGDLERFVRTIPAGQGPFNIYVGAGGAAVSPALRRAVREKLSDHLVVTYGSNEVNGISRIGDDDVGTLHSDVQVTIVDDRGEPVPQGTPGVIRVRADTMVDGYIDPDLTRAAFFDGWYQTNDIGYQPAPDKLIVLGRADDMLNVGGRKIAPGPIEERLKMIDEVRDAVVTTVPDGQGSNVMLVAVETGAGGCTPDLMRLVTPIMRSYTPIYQLIGLPVFPRTETGKVRRQAILDTHAMG